MRPNSCADWLVHPIPGGICRERIMGAPAKCNAASKGRAAKVVRDLFASRCGLSVSPTSRCVRFRSARTVVDTSPRTLQARRADRKAGLRFVGTRNQKFRLSKTGFVSPLVRT
jgi:hypothetical protein